MLLFIGDSIIGQLTKKDKLVEDLSLIAFNGGAFIENVLKNSLCTEQEMTTAIRPNRRRGPTPAPIVWTSCNSIADFESWRCHVVTRYCSWYYSFLYCSEMFLSIY